jgi:hypothetical protein
MTALRANNLTKQKNLDKESADTLVNLNPKVNLHHALGPKHSTHTKATPSGNEVITIDKVTPELAA